MYGFDFKYKLKRLNPKLYVDDTSERHLAVNNAKIMLRETKRTDIKSNYNYAGEASHHMQAVESGQTDQFVTGVPGDWVPEYDEFNKEGKVVRKGYRTILHFLAKQKLISLEKAHHLFGYGPSFYEHLSFEEKRDFQVRRNNK